MENNAPKLKTRNRAFIAAYLKGRKAFADGKDVGRDCPYYDHRGSNENSVTFSRAFIRHWTDGWMDAKQERNS
jgi:hypothetical protein